MSNISGPDDLKVTNTLLNLVVGVVMGAAICLAATSLMSTANGQQQGSYDPKSFDGKVTAVYPWGGDWYTVAVRKANGATESALYMWDRFGWLPSVGDDVSVYDDPNSMPSRSKATGLRVRLR